MGIQSEHTESTGAAHAEAGQLPPLRALLIADTRPGHYHLSEGIIAAVERLRPVEVTRLTVRRRLPGHVLATLCRVGLASRWILQLGYGIDANALPRADLVVSAGAETLAASISAARLLGAVNIHYGSLRRFRPEDFDLVLTSYADEGARPRHAMILKPSALQLPAITRECAADPNSACTFALLLGGDSGECRYDTEEWSALLDFVERSSRQHGVRWKISNSRRTPASVSDSFALHARTHAQAIALFVDVRQAGASTLGHVLAGADAVFCTDDSSSMISECVAARLPVIGVRSRGQNLTPQEQGYRDFMASRGWYGSIPIAELNHLDVRSVFAGLRPMQGDALGELAALLRERLPRLFARAL